MPVPYLAQHPSLSLCLSLGVGGLGGLVLGVRSYAQNGPNVPTTTNTTWTAHPIIPPPHPCA